MAATDGLSAREAKRLQTRERLMGAAIGEFKRTGMADADIGAIVAAAGVAHGTFFFHFPTKQHVLLELELREEQRMVKQLGRFLRVDRDLTEVLNETIRLIFDLEHRLGVLLFKDFLSAHFSQTRPPDDGREHPLIDLVAQRIELARDSGAIDPQVTPINSAVFFLLGLYALLITTSGWPNRRVLVEDYLIRTMRSLAPAE
ncbi:TetR family transcriptional regulator [Nocardia asiatica]|uniref:TetR family transcriptional regulator n=1 Tax=Nocardia asiatica TaxID=209252 RepID=UPI003EE061A6